MHDVFYVELMELGAEAIGEPLRGISGHGAGMRCRLVDTDQHGTDQPANASFSIAGNGVDRGTIH